jgi:hypothetical protein
MAIAANLVASGVLFLIPETDEARDALPHGEDLCVTHFPFKVGRESRAANAVAKLLSTVERRILQAPPLNDLYLQEAPSPNGFHISREHFQIDRIGTRYVLTDRKTTCGTWVNDRLVDGRSEQPSVELRDGDVITVGRQYSPFRFQFRVLPE